MNDNNQHIQQLIRRLSRVPYLASKNLYRVIDYFLSLDEASFDAFCKTLISCKANIKRCDICMAWQETGDICEYCSNPSRNKNIICVVESWNDLMLIERTGAFTGQYHILGGLICPLDGIGAKDLFIDQLVSRFGKKNEFESLDPGFAKASPDLRKLGTNGLDEKPENLSSDGLVSNGFNIENKELVFALSQSPEGEVTATYIANKLKDKNVKISALARGLPVGSSLENTDRLTVFKALSERRPF